MANITILGKGRDKRYKVTFEVPREGLERKRRSKTFPPGTSYQFVLDFKRQKEIELATGEMITSKEVTLSEFIEQEYFENHIKFLSPTTVANYKKLYSSGKEYCIKKTFGNYKIKDINRRMIQRYVNLLADNVSPKTVRSYKMWLHTVFDIAIALDIIKPGTNPTEYVKLPPKSTSQIEAYTAEQIQQLLQYAEEDITSQVIIALGALAGLRRGELAGLKWSHIFIDNGQAEIHIRETRVVIDGKEYVKPPKTKAGRRIIPIPQGLVAILKKARTKYLENKLRLGKDFFDSGYVLSQEDGRAYKPDGISIHYERHMYGMIEKGIPYKSLHKLRHTYATLLIDGGANPKVLQKSLGHESAKISMEVYAHAYSERHRKEIDKLDEVIFGTKSSVS